MTWVLADVYTPVGSAPEARYDGTFEVYGDALESLHEALIEAGVDPWRATSPQNNGPLERVWWTGAIDGGVPAGVWRSGRGGPAGARVITRMQLTPDHTTS